MESEHRAAIIATITLEEDSAVKRHFDDLNWTTIATQRNHSLDYELW